MHAVPASRIILFVTSQFFRDRILKHFAHERIAPDRIEFLITRGWKKYVRTYNRIDLILDSFPNCSGVTACDALWMGLPIITLKGDIAAQRMCCMVLHEVGLSDLAADSPHDYLQIPTHLAADLPRLSEVRSTLRARLESSPLMNAPTIAQDLQRIFTEISQTSAPR
jgi:predicted O-linked N-acetylglucosamine transferase (SPINDLY family)